MGSFLSFANVFLGKAHSKAIVAYNTTASLLPVSIVKDLFAQNKAFEQRAYINSIFYFVKMFPKEAGPLSTMEENRLNEFVANCDLKELQQ